MVGLVYRGHFLRRLRKQESGNGQKLPDAKEGQLKSGQKSVHMQERFHDKIRHTRKVNHKFNATAGKKWNNRSTSKHRWMHQNTEQIRRNNSI